MQRNKLSEKEIRQEKDRKLIFNVTNYPLFRYLKKSNKKITCNTYL